MTTMKKKVQLTKLELEEIKSILGENISYAIIFGSRAYGNAKKFSDLDLCLKFSNSKEKSPSEFSILGDLREKFDNSNLPFIVDLSSYKDLPNKFQKLIDEKGVPVAEACE
jgi:predicted nucleotidyltransferase